VLTLSEVRRLKILQHINIYISNRPVADVAELRGKWNLWSKVATLEISADQPEFAADLPLPVTATNLLFEFVTVSASAAERMQCPRCNRAVTDTRHGVCRHCRENAFQCRLCRNINYEHLQAFLCNECGYCKHARFDWSLLCCTSFTIDAIADEADKAKTISAIQRESENAHKCFQDIIACKRTLEQLLSPHVRGECHMPAMACSSLMSNVTASIISRQLQAVAVVYGQDAKRSFHAMAHSVRMLSALGKQLASYLGLPSSSASSASMGIRQSRGHCFGCATK
jgi:E3 ubiquitin-protein ligase UBR4